MTMHATSTRVEDHTAPEINDRLRAGIDAEVTRLDGAPAAEIAARLRELDHEWDIERVLQLNASAVVLLGLVLAVRVNRRYLILPAAVFSFFLQHAVQGWCPPLPVFRRLGVRTAREIERERYAIKALRGDFDHIPKTGTATTGRRVRAALWAVDA